MFKRFMLVMMMVSAVLLAGFTAPASADAMDDYNDAESRLGNVSTEYVYENGPYAAPTNYTCENRKKVSANTKIMEAGGGDYYDDIWRTRVYYKHCQSITNWYDDIGLVHLSLQRTGVKGCRHTDFDKFYLNPSSLAGVNVAGFDQNCVVGQENYMRSYFFDVRLGANEGDRCFNHNWKYRIVGGNDIEGWSESKCL